MVRILECLVIVLILSSCGKDEPTGMTNPIDMEPGIKLLLLKEVRVNDLLSDSYIYNPDSTVLQSTNYSASTGDARFIFDYTYTNNIIECAVTSATTGELNSSRKYTNVNQTEGLEEFFDGNGELAGFNTYTFDNNSCGYSDLLAVDALGNILPSNRIEYIDENCSAIHYSQYDADPEYVRWEYTRNDKFDANNSTILPFFRIDKQQSLTKLVRKSQAGTISTNLSYDAEIDYNEHGFPLMETRIYGDGDVLVLTYEYY